MSYQRFGTPANPQAYIWSNGEALHIAAEGKSHDGSQYEDGIVEVVLDVSDTRTAESLFLALYDHLKDAGKNIRFNKKTGELRFTPERHKG